MVEEKKKKWDELEVSLGLNPSFSDWFAKNKQQNIQQKMLSCVRTAAGLGNPPEHYYQNSSESINHLLKLEAGFKKHTWPEFNEIAKRICVRQRDMSVQAIYGGGNYQLAPEFQQFYVPPLIWRSKTEAQRREHVKKFLSARPKRGNEDTSAVGNPTCEKNLSIKSYEVSIPSVAPQHLEKIFCRAENLLSTKDSITAAPGGNENLKIVISFHTVDLCKSSRVKGKLACSCLGFKGVGICSHTVAIAESSNFLSEHLHQVAKKIQQRASQSWPQQIFQTTLERKQIKENAPEKRTIAQQQGLSKI